MLAIIINKLGENELLREQKADLEQEIRHYLYSASLFLQRYKFTY